MFKKVIKGIAIFILVLLIALVSLPFLFKSKIEKAVKASINEQLNATVFYGDVGISIFRSFPKLSLSIDDITIVGKADFANDTLTSIKELDLAVDIMSILKSGQVMKVLGVSINEMKLNAIVLPDGKTNWDILKPAKNKPTESQPLKLSLKNIQLKDAKIAYSDLQSDMFVVLNHLNFEGGGDFGQDVFKFVTNTSIDELSYQSANVAYLKRAKVSLKSDFKVDQIQDKYSFEKSQLSINDLMLNFDGYVKLLEDATDLDLTFAAEKTDFKNLLSLVPSIYAKDFDKVKTAGKIELNGMVKGKYTETSYPSFKLHAKINEAMFQYPDLPTKVSNINALVDVNNEKGGSLDNTTINIPKLHVAIDNEPVDMVLFVSTPMSDPYIDGTLKGKINLKKVPEFYPIEGLKKLEGMMLVDVQARARMSQIQKEDYQNVYAAGTADITNLIYESTDLDWPVHVTNMNLKFNPKTVEMTGFNGNIGKSDFHATGSLSNFLPYIFSNDVIKGNLTLTSANLDLNEIMDNDAAPAKADAAASSATSVIEIPGNIDFNLNSNIAKITFKDIVMSNMSGNIIVKDKSLDISSLTTDLLGGSLRLSGKYDTKDINDPAINFNYDITSIDFQKTFAAVPSMQKLAPIAKYLNGLLTTNMNLTTKLNPDLTPNYNTLTGSAKVKIDYAKLVNLPAVQKIAEVTKLQMLNPLEVKNAWTELKFENGRVRIEKPYVIKVQDYGMTITGSNGFDKTMDYNVSIDVPADKLGNAKSVAQGLLAKVPIPGLNGLLPEVLTFNLKIGGTMEKPTVTLGKMTAGTNGKSIQQQATETIKQEVTKIVDDAKEKAQLEAQKQVDAAKVEAQKQIDKAKADAAKAANDQLNKAKNEIKKNIKLPW